ncbi:hypothetical protein [Streptomyces sp. NPDC053755]|uniref:hypothetical protein n=1 Tax=Streptomyces sp. NPDC053755 TaxID=3155815 RepID=UPI00342A5A96
MVRRRLRLAAVLTVVVLALTGFQTSAHSGKSSAKGRGGSSGSGGGSGDSGGGCSSSKKKNDDYDGSGSGSGETYTSEPSPSVTTSPTSTVEVVVVDCVEAAQKKRKGKPARKADTTATLRITSRATFTETFQVQLGFEDAGGYEVDDADATITVEPGETKTFEVAMDTPKAVGEVRNCVVGPVREQ